MNPLASRLRRALRSFQQPVPSQDVEPASHYPASLQDVRITIAYIRHAFRERLPDELLKHILYHADYDCLHYIASSSEAAVRSGIHDGTKLSDVSPYVETAPLCLSPAPEGGRIRCLTLHATGKDQGWVQDRESASWSWFEVRKRPQTLEDYEWQAEEGFAWARNRVALKEWQDHELAYHVDDEISEDKEQVAAWARELQNGDRVSIVPMAQYGGWQCMVQKASIDVEVEVWM